MSKAANRTRRIPRHAFESLETRSLLSATVIDVMVLYDTDALAQFNNSEPAIQKAIRQSIDIANLAHQNTADNAVLRLVRTQSIAYSNPGAPESTQLSALRANSTVANLRNTYGADLVSMVINSAEGGGLGDLPNTPAGDSTAAFSVVGYESIGPGSLVLAHEMGHNMGAGHERDNIVGQFAEGVFPDYSFGYHTAYDGSSIHGSDYGDVMSYQGKTLPVFSDPAYIHDGVALGRPIGDPHAADLHTTFLATAPNIANYKPTVVADAAPTATLWQTDLSGDQLTFQVRYTDDISISASTLDSNDAYVVTPEGFHLQAEFLSADTAGDAYAKVATYRITLPKNNPPLASLQFFLNASQVNDSANHPVAGGQLANNVDGDLERGLAAWEIARDTGELNAGITSRITGAVGDVNDRQDIYRFTTTATTNLSLTLSGLTSSATLFLFRDDNLNEQQDGGEGAGNSQQSGTADRTLSAALTPGTYYVYIQLDSGQPVTPYTLTLQTASPIADVIPPNTPILDKADASFAGTTTTLDFYVIYTDNVGIDASSVKNNGYLIFFNPTGSGIIKTPADITVSGTSVIAHYNHTFNTAFGSGTVTVQLSNQAGFLNQTRDLAGNLIGGLSTTIGTYKVGTLATDVSAPVASLSSAPQILIPGATTYDFVVAYKDNRGIDASSFNSNEIVVNGPAGSGIVNLPASFQSSAVSPGGGLTYATYRITPPGGAWDWHDDGNYSVILQPTQVKDGKGNFAGPTGAANPLGTFNVHVPFPGDTNGDDTTGFEDLVAVAQNYGLAGRGQTTGDLDFDGVVGFSDLVLVAQNYGGALPTPIPGAPVSLSEEILPTVKSITPKTTATSSRPVSVTKPKPTRTPTAPKPIFTAKRKPAELVPWVKSTFSTASIARGVTKNS